LAKEKKLDTTLTLNIAQNVVDSAEIYARHAQKSVSQLVEEYLFSISNNEPLGPITKQLAGIITLEKNINHQELLANTLAEKYL
jgi:hypothetical protein